MATKSEVLFVQKAILRNQNSAEADEIVTANTPLREYAEQLIERAESSTQAAMIVAVFMTGLIPISSKLDELTAFCLDQYKYYSDVLKVTNPYLGPYEAMGRGFASSAEFAAISDGRSDGQFITEVYVRAFGMSPNTGHVRHFDAQLAYFHELYVDSGIADASASIQARGAVLGQIIGLAATVEGSILDNAAEAFLRAAATGSAFYGAPPSFSGPIEGPAPLLAKTLGSTSAIGSFFSDEENELVEGENFVRSDDVQGREAVSNQATLDVGSRSLKELLEFCMVALTAPERIDIWIEKLTFEAGEMSGFPSSLTKPLDDIDWDSFAEDPRSDGVSDVHNRFNPIDLEEDINEPDATATPALIVSNSDFEPSIAVSVLAMSGAISPDYAFT